MPDGSWVVTEMGRGQITRLDPDGGARASLADTPRPNGLAVDGDGGLWIAESVDGALIHRAPSGSLTSVSVGVPGTPFLWPNDLCFGPDGWIYLTDSGVEVARFETRPRPTRVDGRLFRVHPISGATELLDRSLRFANGLAFGPDGSLYVAETLTGDIVRYDFESGRLGPGRVFATVVGPGEVGQGDLVGPDGMAFDVSGNLLVAVLGRGDITVVDRAGRVTAHLPLPGPFPTNIAFGLPGTQAAVVTEGSRGELLQIPWPVDGLALHQPDVR